jgi:hypothetical protein
MNSGNSAKWELMPIFFKEISFFDFLEESTMWVLKTAGGLGRENRGKRFSLPKAGLISHFAEFHGWF